jgi:AraC family transcriptional regulator, transcriptional activator of pobA
MNDAIPTYELYGELLPGTDLDFLHCETISSRSSLHGGVIRPHRHADLFQLFYICRGEVRVTLDASVFEPRVPCMLAIPSITVHSFVFGEATEGWVVTIPDTQIRRLLASTPGLLPDLETPTLSMPLIKGAALRQPRCCSSALRRSSQILLLVGCCQSRLAWN